jgi:glycosyltransferase involved in cell wall biosynthesis
MKKIMLLVPAYNEEEVLPLFMEKVLEVTDQIQDYQFEFLFVNDGSTDRTQDIIHAYHLEDERVNYVELSRNFGKETAMLAGFDYADGDAVIIIDADLQHPPAMITRTTGINTQ